MKKRTILIMILYILTIVTFSFSSFVLAKYVRTKPSSIGVSTDNFYFTVNLLGDTNEEEDLSKEYNLYGGDSKEIPFIIQNYFDELRITKSKTVFNVEVVEGNEYASINLVGDQELNGNVSDSKTCMLSIVEGYSDETVVKVKISSKSPFIKTMYLSFKLHTFSSNLQVGLKDSVGSLYLELVISANTLIPKNHIIINYADINNTNDALQVDITNNYVLDEDNTLGTNKLPDGKAFLQEVVITRDLKLGEAIDLYFFKANPSLNYANLNVNILTAEDASGITYTITLSKVGGE